MKPLQFAVGLLATFASCSLYAQTMNVRVNIPFEFRVGETLMPAGDYSVRHANGWLALQENGGRAVAAAVTYATDLESTKPVLQFNQYGDTYFLGKVSIPDFGIARAIFKTLREKELARRSSPGQTTIAFQSK